MDAEAGVGQKAGNRVSSEHGGEKYMPDLK